MPAITTLGAISARGFGFGGRRAAQFIGSYVANSASLVTWPAGTQAGDFAIAHAKITNPISSGSGWTSLPQTFWSHGNETPWNAYKVLTSGDISSPPSLQPIGGPNSVPAVMLVYRGASAITVKYDAQAAGSSPYAVPSWAPSANTKGALLFFDLLNDAVAGVVTFPAGWTARTSVLQDTQLRYGVVVADALLSNGQSFQITGNTIQPKIAVYDLT